MKFQMPELKTVITVFLAGRRFLSFESKINTMISNIGLKSSEIVSAARCKLHKSGQRNVVQPFNEAKAPPGRASKIKKRYIN